MSLRSQPGGLAKREKTAASPVVDVYTRPPRFDSLELHILHPWAFVRGEIEELKQNTKMVKLTVKTIKGKKFQIDVEQTQTVSLSRTDAARSEERTHRVCTCRAFSTCLPC